MKQRIILGIAIAALVVFVYDSVVVVLFQWLRLVSLPALPGGTQTRTVLLMTFSVLHAWYSLGWKHTLSFLALSAVISLIFEEVGVATGAIYGPYHYTDVLGLKIGLVPVLIPIAWFTMIYPSYVIADLITQGEPTGSKGNFWRIAWLALISGMIMTAWDLLVDPILSHPDVHAWIWDRPGSYFSIPIQNYVGWMLTTFTVYLVYRLFERRSAPKPIGPLTNRIVVLAIVAYASMLAANMLGGPSALIVIGPFSMGLAVVFALDRLFRRSSTA